MKEKKKKNQTPRSHKKKLTTNKVKSHASSSYLPFNSFPDLLPSLLLLNNMSA